MVTNDSNSISLRRTITKGKTKNNNGAEMVEKIEYGRDEREKSVHVVP